MATFVLMETAPRPVSSTLIVIHWRMSSASLTTATASTVTLEPAHQVFFVPKVLAQVTHATKIKSKAQFWFQLSIIKNHQIKGLTLLTTSILIYLLQGCSDDYNCESGKCDGNHMCTGNGQPIVTTITVKTSSCSGCSSGNVEEGLMLNLKGRGSPECTTERSYC